MGLGTARPKAVRGQLPFCPGLNPSRGVPRGLGGGLLPLNVIPRAYITDNMNVDNAKKSYNLKQR